MKTNRFLQINAFLRGLYLILSAILLTAFLAVPAIAACLLDRSGSWPSRMQQVWVRWLLRVNRIQLRAEGLENLEENRAYLIFSNHSSPLDIPGIVAAIPLPVRFIAKKSLAWFPVFGWFLNLARHILIDRESALSARKILKKASSLMAKGISVIVFPEGTRSPDGEVKEFKKGVFFLALQSKVPLIPVSISGTYQMLPRKGWGLWPGAIEVCVGEPVPTEEISRREVRPLVTRIRNEVLRNLEADLQEKNA